jgi:hypothetical protein
LTVKNHPYTHEGETFDLWGGAYVYKRNYGASLIAFTVVSVLFATSAFAALPLAMSGRGSGTETGVAGSCNGSGNSCTGSNCECYPFSGTGTATGVGALTFQTNLLVNKPTLEDNLAKVHQEFSRLPKNSTLRMC